MNAAVNELSRKEKKPEFFTPQDAVRDLKYDPQLRDRGDGGPPTFCIF